MKPIITPTDGTDEKLSTAILIKEDDTRFIFERLREQEIENNGFTTARGANDGKITKVAVVEIEEIRPSCRRFQQRNRLTPMIACRRTCGKIMRARKSRKIGGRDQTPARERISKAR